MAGTRSFERGARGDKRNWLLIKHRDEGADARRNPVSTEPKSVLSGRTITQVRREEAAKRKAKRGPKEKSDSRRGASRRKGQSG